MAIRKRSSTSAGPRKKSMSRPRSTRRARQPSRQSAQKHGQIDTESTDRLVRARPRTPSAYAVVGIGASAGGVEVVSKILQRLTPDTDLAYVLVQHLAPDHESLLPDVLRGAARIPVVQAVEQMPIQPNRLHVIPPNVAMTVVDGHLHLAPRPVDRSQYNPIDAFFQSLAEQVQHRAIGIVLSGSASDGAAGLREINGAGGLTIVQDPKTARYDGMPRAAIATGAADLVLSPEAIAEELVRLGAHPFLTPAPEPGTQELPVTDAQFERLFAQLRSASGVDFTQYKLPTIKRRLQRRMALHKTTDLDAYLKLLEHEAVEVKNLYRDILIHVTRFFREPASFLALKKTVFPRILEEAKGPVRIWVPGCATGEEAYSIAIALLESLGGEATSTPIQIFATDVSEEAVERARAGVYPDSISSDVSTDRLRRFFTRLNGQFRINKIVRDSCIFARQDLTRDPPFSKLDLIVCRNVLIYLGPRLQRKLMNVFHYALKPGGFLVLGSAETAGATGELFVLHDKRHKIYTKRAGIGHVAVDFGLVGGAGQHDQPARAAARPARPTDIQAEVIRLLVGRYSPPCVLVDSDFHIIQTRGRTGPYLELATGEASLNLLKMAREGLLHALRSALQEARQNGKPARREGLIVRSNGGAAETDVQVLPITDDGDPNFLVLFETTGGARPEHPRGAERSRRTGKRGTSARIVQLERELSSSREYLQSIIQDLEATNEELQSANEEILSSNEELQSTNEELDTAKEELQSTNEELNTLNEELNARNEELGRINSDLLNLLSAVPAAIVIVSADLRIRRFTPLAEHLLNLIPTDVGRPIGDIKPNVDIPNLIDLTHEVIETVTVKELELQDRGGRSYLLRIRPYKDQENRIDGAVLAFLDVAHPQSSPAG